MKYKNETILIISSTVLGIAFLTMPVLAATSFSFSPASINTTQGQSFDLAISFDPQGVKNYTVKLELDYPADLLEVKSFSFGNNWMPITQAGYDLIDNINGQLIKTAGYPGGLSSTATFGTISFSAKKDGTGAISVRDNSFAFDATNQNLFSGASQASVVITAPAPAEIPLIPEMPSVETPTPKESVTPAPSEKEGEEEITPPTEEGEEVTTPEEEKPAETAEGPSFLAAIGNVITFGTGNAFIGVIVSIIALLILFFIVRRIRLRKSK